MNHGPSPPTLSDLDKITLTGSKGHVVMRIGHIVNLFFEDGGNRAKREALVEIARDYDRLVGPRLRFFQAVDGGPAKPVSPGYLDRYSRNAQGFAARKPFTVRVYGDDWNNDGKPVAHFMEAMAKEPNDFGRMSNVEINFPASWPEEHGYDLFIARIRQWCAWLQPTHGTAGLALIFPENAGGWTGYDLLASPFIRRFPGLDFIGSISWGVKSGAAGAEKIRSVNWLTMLNQRMVEQVGGPEALADALGPECPVHDFGAGLMLQAGPRPDLGDSNQGLVPGYYRRVAKAVKSLIFRDYKVPLFQSPPPLDSKEEMQAWLDRFD